MPGARLRVRPAAPPEDFELEGSPDPDCETGCESEASLLELHLQRQLEEDVARIFDESIFSDIEVVCGKTKVLTNSCILKARASQFHDKLESILHANIERDTFDEIYSFISDAYTECNIKLQEKEIIDYLNDNLDPKKPNLTSKEHEEPEVFLTPKCATPYIEKDFHSITANPSTDLTKEYYALVTIDGAQDKELKEQDALSDAFQSIINSQGKDFKAKQQRKPASLPVSSHISQTVKHSSSCDILNNLRSDITELTTEPDVAQPSQDPRSKTDLIASASKAELVYSPDSLIADDPSSASDYLSAVYTCSPGTSVGVTLLNVGDSITNMENTITSSDSGLENTGLLESLTSNKDITLTDVSLTESTLHELTADETNSSSFSDKNHVLKFRHGTQSTSGASSENGQSVCLSGQSPKVKGTGRKSSKEEKQRQNEEIVILESSSLSSETGSWESVFPPKVADKETCENFITGERLHSIEGRVSEKICPNHSENIGLSLVQKSPFKTTSCFIDAASLVDEEDETIKVVVEPTDTMDTTRNDAIPAPSQPLPCSTAKFDSSHDWSDGNEDDDSLEQLDSKDPDPDSIQKDLSPTIFDMTPITEDSLCAGVQAFEAAQVEENKKIKQDIEEPKCSTEKECHASTVLVSGTPHNSILSLRTSSLKQYESEDSESDTTLVGSMGVKKTMMKFNEASPIVSGGASIEDHLPLMTSHSSSPLIRRRIENIPIVSGAYVPKIEEKTYSKSPKPSNASAWVVDMSDVKNGDKISENTSTVKKPGDRTCELLRNGSKSSLDSCHSLENNKSRSSIDSDGSERSSHKFYIDLSSLPDPPPKNNDSDSEKKNIFSMYIDLGKKPTKEMPARLSSSLNTRRTNAETKSTSKSQRTVKAQHAETKPTEVALHNFEKYESLCNDPNINIKEIINILDHETTAKTKPRSSGELVKMERDKSPRHVEKIKSKVSAPVIKEEPGTKAVDLFVKLSDLDKPAQVIEPTERCADVRMTRSIPDNNWKEQQSAESFRTVDIISSFHSENALSLNRLFPHLKNELSRSTPGALNPMAGRSPLRMAASSSAGDAGEDPPSDMSEVSSVQSSMGRSCVENSITDDTSQASSLVTHCQSRLGQDLLRMFLQEIAPDVIVEINGRRIKAHKCILSSRCQYFAGILSGGWVESAGNVIVLPPFSFNVAHFALCHIYSGMSCIPDYISIVELATIADMLGLEGLKEAIMMTLKSKYCHYFHRPCRVCTAGVLECFPLSSVYGLDDLYRKCLKWISKYFAIVWPTKAFATLPKELLDKCYQHLIVNITIDNLVDTVFGIGIVVERLQNSRWADSVARMCRRFVTAAAHYAAPRLMGVLKFVSEVPSDPPACAVQAFDDCMAAAFEWAPPEEACRAYAYLSTVAREVRQPQQLFSIENVNRNTPQFFIHDRAIEWRLQCEGALVRNAPRVVVTQAYRDLPPELRRRLRELGCIMFGAQPVVIPPPPVQDRRPRRTAASTTTVDIEQVRASFVPYAQRPSPRSDAQRSSNDLRDKKAKTLPPKIRTTKAQEKRARFNQTKNSEVTTSKTVPPRSSYEKTKPRYLEPKVTKECERRHGPGVKLAVKMISSSESSRNSSPNQARNHRGRGALRSEARVEAMSQDSLASRPKTAEPSTESLTESQASNKYATYTKVKHTNGSVESVTSSKLSSSQQQASSFKAKTKIPVYLNQVRHNGVTDPQRRAPQKPTPAITQAKKPERKVPGSLMMATKSSSAKMVPKVVKETPPKGAAKPKRVNKQPDPPKPDIPAMERSGTFLKDEPTFGDKTTNIDIDDEQ